MILVQSPDEFLAASGIFLLGSTLMADGVPLGIFEVAPPEAVGAFNGARLMLMSGASAGSALILGYLLDSVGIAFVLGAAAVIHLLTGALFWHGFRQKGATR